MCFYNTWIFWEVMYHNYWDNNTNVYKWNSPLAAEPISFRIPNYKTCYHFLIFSYREGLCLGLFVWKQCSLYCINYYVCVVKEFPLTPWRSSCSTFWIGHVNEYPTMHSFGNPRHTQSIIAYMILTEYFWKFQWTIALWECC